MSVIRTVPPSVRNCTQRGTFPINCKEFPNFFLITMLLNIFIKKTVILLRLHRTRFSTDIFFVHVFYTLKDVLLEMIEIVPPYHTSCRYFNEAKQYESQ